MPIPTQENVAIENITAFYADSIVIPGEFNLAFLHQTIVHLKFIAIQPLDIRHEDKGFIPAPITGMAQRSPEFQKTKFNIHCDFVYVEISRVYYESFFSILLLIIEIKRPLSVRLHPI